MSVNAGNATSASSPSGIADPTQVCVTVPVKATLPDSNAAKPASHQPETRSEAKSTLTARSTEAQPSSPPLAQASPVM